MPGSCERAKAWFAEAATRKARRRAGLVHHPGVRGWDSRGRGDSGGTLAGVYRNVETLALDVEGTLISNALSQVARPGLHRFLEFCRSRFPRLVVYSGVEERRFRRIAGGLILEGSAPRWFGDLPFVFWSADYRDLRLIPGAAVESTWIVDDLEEAIHPEQTARWIRIAPFERPYPVTDVELARVTEVLSRRLSEIATAAEGERGLGARPARPRPSSRKRAPGGRS